jgi:trans-2,3-dihydro-3-hydroxyanthranilate isomerase
MRTYRFVQVDVFGTEIFAGNPLAVFPEAQGLSDAEMQAIAREMNLSETAFVTPAEGEGDVRVRIFTPVVELPFAGHPSLGTACTVVRLGAVPAREPFTPVVLELNVGPTLVDVEVRDGAPVAAVVHQGAPHFGAQQIIKEEVAPVMRLHYSAMHAYLPPLVVGTGLDYTIVPLRDVDALADAWFDLELLPEFERKYAGLYAFALTGADDPLAEARCFAPLEGIPEDPATGSAAGPLAAYLARVGLLKPGEMRMLAQGRFAGRPSRLSMQVLGSRRAMTDVLVGGGVVPVLAGELTLP